MLDIRRDIQSLTDFKKNSSQFIEQLKETGEPVVLTINGRAELVVQDAGFYQALIELADQAEQLEINRRAVAEMKAGLGRPTTEMLPDMRKVIDQKRGQWLTRFPLSATPCGSCIRHGALGPRKG